VKHPLKLTFALLAAVLAGVLLFTLFLIRSGSGTFPALPSPNGYDDFVAAGNLLDSQTSDAHAMEIGPLRALIGTNSESLRLLQLGLSRTCSVHTAEMLTNSAAMSPDLLATKRVAHLLAGTGRLAELEGRTNDAVAAYLTGMRFGNEISRGGFVMQRLVGVACEALARNRLTLVAAKLSPTDMRGIIRALEKLEIESVPWGEIDDNERRFMWSAVQQFNNPIMLVNSWWTLRPLLKQARVKHLNEITRRRLLIIELALRCHGAAHGSPPKELGDLVPEFLARVPLDTFTERALIYRPNGTNWSLYSVGPDRADDGGVAGGSVTGRKPPGGDVLLDSPQPD